MEAGVGARDKHFTVMSAALISAVKIKMAPELCLFTSRQDDPYKQRDSSGSPKRTQNPPLAGYEYTISITLGF